MAIFIGAYDHVGLRVADRERALAFYADLGFAVDPRYTSDGVAEIVNAAGVRLNLIFNGVCRDNNILLDEPDKWPGYTHAASSSIVLTTFLNGRPSARSQSRKVLSIGGGA